MSRIGDGTWAYEPAKFSEVPKRTRTVGLTVTTDKQGWDAQGRLLNWETKDKVGVKGAKLVANRAYDYDSAGRLVGVTTTGPNAPDITTYGYDVDDGLVLEVHGTQHIHRFQGYRHDSASGQIIESCCRR